MNFKPDQNIGEQSELDINEGWSPVLPRESEDFGELTPGVELEKPNKFIGEAVEVTVVRNASGGKPERVEGGWRVSDKNYGKDGRVIVVNSKGQEKSYNAEKLSEMQPFQIGDTVPTIRNDGSLDTEGVTIVASSGGYFDVRKMMNGESMSKIVLKHDLIKAKIAELEAKKSDISGWKDTVSEDGVAIRGINEELKYWQDKLKMIDLINKDQQDKPE